MTPHEVDIPWQLLRDIVAPWAGDGAELDSVTPLAGGSINTTLALGLKDGRQAVLKITPHRVNHAHADEAWQLALIGSAGLPVPTVHQYKVGSLDDPHSYILMEYIDGIDLAAARSSCSPEEFEELQVELADYLLKLHANTHSHFQRAIGGEVKKFESWPHCYQDIFEPIVREVHSAGLVPIKSRKLLNRLHDRLDTFLSHTDVPRLVHWDLWANNLKIHRNGDGKWHVAAFLDPHCKYGHVEAELAYLELFQTVTPAFMKAYQQSRKLPIEYHQVRKPIYQVYSMLNDLSLFGPEYLKPTLAAIDRVGHLV